MVLTAVLHALIAVLGGPAYVESVPGAEVFDSIALHGSTRPDITATTKFLVPASADPGLLGTVYQNVNIYPFHIDFMVAEFPERFPALDANEYRRLVEQRATRKYFAGAVYRLEPGEGEILYGFDFYTDAALESELPRLEEAEWVYQLLSESFGAGPLVYAPLRSEVMALARNWENASFQVYLPDFGLVGDYRAYTTGTAYGRLRIFTLGELLAASAEGSVSWQDVVVVDEAPGDLTAPVACVITASPQTELSHLSLRLAQRGTPNAFFAQAIDELGPLADRLLRVDVLDGLVTVEEVLDPDEAEAWWQSHRPRLPLLPSFDLEEDRLLGLEALASDPEATSKYGAKVSNLALLAATLPPEHVVAGFGVPFAWYERFMNENLVPNPSRGGLISYAEFLSRLEDDEAFRTDPVFRNSVLGEFVNYMEDFGEIPPELIDAVSEQILQTFGDRDVKVRFRSSSNFEDIVPFNGAGLYESTSACVPDSLDEDSHGPSLCDPAESEERTLERAFRRVWTSLWLPRAYNERDFWQAPQDRAKMGILVSTAFTDELANGVVVTGNPSLPGDDRLVINVQPGEASVVHPEPGVLPEKILLETDAAGSVTRVTRVRPSSLLPSGEWVLSEAEATEVGELAALAARELGPHYATGLGEILLDLEFKVVGEAGERRIVFKQARPFLREESSESVPLALIVPPGTSACGVFREWRSLETEYSVLSTLDFISGRLELPARAGSVDGELVENILVGPQKTPALPQGSGLFTCEVISDGTVTGYSYTFTQEFLVGDSPFSLAVKLPIFRLDSAGEDRTEIVLDESFLTFREIDDIRGTLEVEGGQEPVTYGSCTYSELSLYETRVTTTTGESATIVTRHVLPAAGTGWENLMSATVELGAQSRTQDDYWRLVYSADHHNWNRRYWVFLDPPVGDAHVVELREESLQQEPPVFSLLDEEFRVIRELEVGSWDRVRVQDPDFPEFNRGDADGDGQLDTADAIRILEALFLGSASLACDDAADANDDGRVNIGDPVRILLHMFGGAGFQIPGAGFCGKDSSPDDLPPCDYDVARCF